MGAENLVFDSSAAEFKFSDEAGGGGRFRQDL